MTQPANGTVVITGGGTGLTYAPDADYCNDGAPPDDTFTYTLSPGGDEATVSVAVTCAPDPSVAVNDSATVAEDWGRRRSRSGRTTPMRMAAPPRTSLR